MILKVEAEVVAVLLDDTEDLDNQQSQSALYHSSDPESVIVTLRASAVTYKQYQYQPFNSAYRTRSTHLGTTVVSAKDNNVKGCHYEGIFRIDKGIGIEEAQEIQEETRS